jgi:hypothetical protein
MKVLYVSGYTADAIVHHGARNADFIFLSKPFSLNTLGRKVRATLDTETVSGQSTHTALGKPAVMRQHTSRQA